VAGKERLEEPARETYASDAGLQMRLLQEEKQEIVPL